MAKSVVTSIKDRQKDGWSDPVRGQLSWFTLFSRDITPTDSLIAGVAELAPGGCLNLHRHLQPEIYFIIEGQGIVTVDGEESLVGPGSAVFIPSDAEHGIRNEFDHDLRLFYTFPTDCFSDVTYRFSEEKTA